MRADAGWRRAAHLPALRPACALSSLIHSQAKAQAVEEAWRSAHAKEERKKRYREAAQSEKRAAGAKRPKRDSGRGGRGGDD